MKHPQSVIQKFNNNSCLFLCYLYAVGLEPDSIPDLLSYFSKAFEKKYIDDECYVKDAEGLIRALTGQKVRVQKVDVKDIKSIVNPAPVWYSIDNVTGHFVVVANGKIVFNPLEKSINVEKGKPITARIISYV